MMMLRMLLDGSVIELLYFTLAISLIFAIIFLILWFCIPSDMPVDEQVKQVSDDIFNILRSNELVPENAFDTIGSFISIYGRVGVGVCILIVILGAIINGNGLQLEIMTSCIVLFVGFNLFIAAFGDEPHNYKYNTDKISTAMKTGDLDSLYEIYGDRGSLLRKSVEKALRPVALLDDENNILSIFRSIKIAGEITNIPQQNIGEVCRGNRDSAGGFKWEYVDKDLFNTVTQEIV